MAMVMSGEDNRVGVCMAMKDQLHIDYSLVEDLQNDPTAVGVRLAEELLQKRPKDEQGIHLRLKLAILFAVPALDLIQA